MILTTLLFFGKEPAIRCYDVSKDLWSLGGGPALSGLWAQNGQFSVLQMILSLTEEGQAID